MAMYKRNKEQIRTLRVSKDSVIDITELLPKQKRCWCIIVQALQDYTSLNIDWENISCEELEKIICLNKHKEYSIKFHLNEITDRTKRKETIKQIEDLLNVEFVYNFFEEGKEKIEKFHLVHRIIIDNNSVEIFLPIITIRRVLNFSRKGFTAFDKKSFLCLSSKYSMDFYLFLSENYKNKIIEISIEDFKERLKCPESYDAEDLKKTVFTPSLREYEKNNTRLSANISLYHKEDNSGKRGRKKLNYIQITIIDREL